MKLVIIRHGESLDDIENRYGGFANYDLTKNGISQAKELTQKLSPLRIDKIYTSPYTRAHDTAKIISKANNIPFEVDINIRERNTYGFLSGMKKEMGEKMFPKDAKNVGDPKTADLVDGSEKVMEVKTRLERFMSKIRSEENTIAIVAHGKVIDILLRIVLGITQKIKFHDCGFMVLDLDTKEILQSDGVDIG